MKVDVKEQLQKATDLLRKGDKQSLEYSLNIFNALLNHCPENVGLLSSIATVFMKRDFNALAIHLFQRVIEKRPTDDILDMAYTNLGYTYKKDERREEAIDAFANALALVPESSAHLANLASCYVMCGMPNEAMRYLDRAREIDPEDPFAKWNTALALLELGRFEEAWPLHTTIDPKIVGEPHRTYVKNKVPTPLWNGEKGKTVIVYGDQGIGDEIMYASMLSDMQKDCTVILDAHPRLYKLFRTSFPNMFVYGTRKDGELSWPLNHHYDYAIPLKDLGQFYRNKKEDFPGNPYLIADQITYNKYKEKLLALPDKPNIGISWKGGTKKTNIKSRQIPLKEWLPIFQSVDANFISLQYTPDASDTIAAFEAETGYKINHWQDIVDDYDETASLVRALDLVVSVPQSIIHLAGAIGTLTLQLNPKQAMWQMGVYGEDAPWYNSVKNIWQITDGDWAPVIQKAKEEICSLLATTT
jgi:hypothetical protein